jgi:type I restriction enzyme R subunit
LPSRFQRPLAHAARARGSGKEGRKDFLREIRAGSARDPRDLLEKYAEHGTAQFVIPDVLKVPPISDRGNVIEIAKLFGGPERLREAVNQLQALLYAA